MAFFLVIFCASYALQSAAEELFEKTMYQEITVADLDELEGLAEKTQTFDCLEVEPPSNFMITLRQWGAPVLVAYCNFKQNMNQSWQWLKESFEGMC
jgi:hypothetical protein